MPFIAVYAATKHYIHAFTEAPAYEIKDSGVVFQEVTPGAVETTLTNPSEFVNSALCTLGNSSKTCGWWPHSSELLVFQSLPDVVGRWAIRRDLEYTYWQIIRNMENKKSECRKKKMYFFMFFSNILFIFFYMLLFHYEYICFSFCFYLFKQ